MPTREPIVDSIIPHNVEKPIPVRVISTRSKPVPAAAAPATPPATPADAVRDQAHTLRDSVVAADSTTPAESVQLSPQLSALARKEQAYRQREAALKQREKELEAKLADAEKFNQLKTKVAAKDYSEAEALGLNYEEYTKYLLAKQNGEKPEEQRFKTVDEKLAELEKNQKEFREQQYEATVSDYKKEIAAFANSSPEYAGFKDPEIQAGILQSILDLFEKDGIEMTIEEAFKLGKEALREQAKKLAAFSEEKPPAQVEEPKTLPPPKKGLNTLTQQVTVGAASAPLKSLQHMSESERYAEARRRALAKREAMQRNQ